MKSTRLMKVREECCGSTSLSALNIGQAVTEVVIIAAIPCAMLTKSTASFSVPGGTLSHSTAALKYFNFEV
jgi:hypothetical protein